MVYNIIAIHLQTIPQEQEYLKANCINTFWQFSETPLSGGGVDEAEQLIIGNGFRIEVLQSHSQEGGSEKEHDYVCFWT